MSKSSLYRFLTKMANRLSFADMVCKTYDPNVPSWQTIKKAIRGNYLKDELKYFHGDHNDAFIQYFKGKDLRNLKQFKTLKLIVSDDKKLRYFCTHLGLNINTKDIDGKTIFHYLYDKHNNFLFDKKRSLKSLIDLNFDFSQVDNEGRICDIMEWDRNTTIHWIVKSKLTNHARLPYSIHFILESLTDSFNIGYLFHFLEQGYRYDPKLPIRKQRVDLLSPHYPSNEVIDYLLEIKHPILESLFNVTYDNETRLRQFLDCGFVPTNDRQFIELCHFPININILHSYGINFNEPKYGSLIGFLCSIDLTPEIIECLSLIINYVQDINVPVRKYKGQGNTFLHEMVRYLYSPNHIEILQMMLKKGGDPNICNDKGRSVLQYYIHKCSQRAKWGRDRLVFDEKIVYLLLDYGADINQNWRGEYLIHTFIHRNVDAEPLLKRGFDINFGNDGQKTKFFLYSYGTPSHIKVFLQYGLNVNLTDGSGQKLIDIVSLLKDHIN